MRDLTTINPKGIMGNLNLGKKLQKIAIIQKAQMKRKKLIQTPMRIKSTKEESR